MKWIDWLVKIAKLIVKGREMGLYNEGNTPAKPGESKFDKYPHQPGDSPR